MADQSVTFESLNLNQILADDEAAEGRARKFIAQNVELDMQFRLKPKGDAAYRWLKAFEGGLAALDNQALFYVLHLLDADLVAVVGFLEGRLVAQGVGKNGREARSLLIAAAQKHGASVTHRVLMDGYASVLEAR